MKLIKINDECQYWEVWEHERAIILHYGAVGEDGISKQYKLKEGDNPEELMAELVASKRQEGFIELTKEHLRQIVIQYRVSNTHWETNLDKRHSVEELLDECLGWTGNGEVDGGEISEKVINVFCFVIDVKKALTTIIKELKKHDYLSGSLIAEEKSEEYEVLFPSHGQYLL